MVFCYNMIHIELSGVPGSGKTFVCAGIAKELQNRGIPVITNPEGLAEARILFRMIQKAGILVSQILLHPVWTSQVLYTIVTSRQSSIKGMFRSFFTIAHVTGTIRRYTKSNVFLVLDQGSVQAFFSLLYDATNMSSITVDRILPVPDVLLETDSPDTILLERLASRTRSQSRVEQDGIYGIQQSRAILSLIRNSSFYRTISIKIPVPDQRPEAVIKELADSIQKRNNNEC